MLESIVLLSLFGSALVFWIIFGVLMGLLFWCVEEDWPGRAAFGLIAFFVLFQFAGNHDPFGWVITHMTDMILLTIGFFVAGTVWAVAKWWFFVRKIAERYVEMRYEWLKGIQAMGELALGYKFLPSVITEKTPVPEQLRNEWRAHHAYGRKYRFVNTCEPVPQARKHKSRIITWMCYWPFSMVWTLLNDPIKALFKKIYSYLSTALQRISDRAFKNIGAEDDAKLSNDVLQLSDAWHDMPDTVGSQVDEEDVSSPSGSMAPEAPVHTRGKKVK